MTDCGKDILLNREGTEQNDRFIKALNPDSVKLNDFELSEWMQFAYNFAKHVNYFDLTNSKVADGNWQAFFKSETELDDFLKEVEKGETLSPHLALFVCFVQLIGFTKKRFNKLNKRHLDFYYQKILQIKKLPATPDKVHVIFELAKNVVSENITAETLLDAGKDVTGKKLNYATSHDLVANKTTVAQLKNVYNDLNNSKIKAAPVADSYDGMGADFPENKIQWWAFGYFIKDSNFSFENEETSKTNNTAEFPELPNARLGFALSSEVLELNQGLRNIMLTIDLKTGLQSVSKAILSSQIEIYLSGEKNWLGPFTIADSVENSKGETVFNSALKNSNKKLQLAVQIPKDEEPVVNYNQAVLGESFNTALPVCRVLIKTQNPKGHQLYRALVEKEIESINIDVDVSGISGLELENDLGKLTAEKPFYPFGTQPVRNSKFYINYKELFKKNWNNIHLNIEWKNTPVDFKEWYFAYRKKYLTQVSANSFINGLGSYKGDSAPTNPVLKLGNKNKLSNATIDKIFEFNSDDLIVTSSNYFKASAEIKSKESWETVNGLNGFYLFTEQNQVYSTDIEFNNTHYEEDKNGPLRLSLNQSFLHELFPRIYALAMSSVEKNALIPNEPYTPFVETIELDYSASATAKLNENDYNSNPVQLFHEHPFGQSEEHLYLKNQLPFIDDAKILIVPTFCKGGELFIGLENAKTNQIVSLLVQVLEGSENPEADSFTGKQKVEWYTLCNNEWKTLDSNYLLENQTDNFLKSGIVKILIPAETSTDNTILPGNLIWLKAKIHKTFDAVCKTIAIKAQAAQAILIDKENDLSHLKNGLPAGSISKLVNRVPTIKSIEQPFNSFDGKPAENDAEYYRRISERLRHKNRAVTIWDYEHIILQNFPEVHKVKGLNHTCKNSFLAPGNVLLIVIPDIKNKNVFDIYQPRLSKATLNKIQDLVHKLNAMFVTETVVNPDYEEVKVEAKIRFKTGFDENFYTGVLNQDITKLLSPWAFDTTSEIKFGQSLQLSVLISYIEKLGYVDYVEDVKLLQKTSANKGFGEVKTATPSSPKAILVSAKSHALSLATKQCKIQTDDIETCQT